MELRGNRVTLKPVTPEHADELRHIHEKPEVLTWWGDHDEGFPFDDDPDTTRFAILVDGNRIAGLVQYGEEEEPDYRHAWIDIFLDPDLHGRGLGAEAVRTLARHLFENKKHHRITIDPAAANTQAINAYEKAGFRAVGTMQKAWRAPSGEWVDVLLMEQVRPLA
jgi:aminoglycoside 6'-N-acetyltransferase